MCTRHRGEKKPSQIGFRVCVFFVIVFGLPMSRGEFSIGHVVAARIIMLCAIAEMVSIDEFTIADEREEIIGVAIVFMNSKQVCHISYRVKREFIV